MEAILQKQRELNAEQARKRAALKDGIAQTVQKEQNFVRGTSRSKQMSSANSTSAQPASGKNASANAAAGVNATRPAATAASATAASATAASATAASSSSAAAALPAAASPSMFNTFTANVGKLFSGESATSLAGISKMRGNTSGQASTSAADAKAALNAATALAGKVQDKEVYIEDLKRKANEQKQERDNAAAAAATAAKVAADQFEKEQAKAAAEYAADKQAKEKEEADAAAARQVAAKADDDTNQAAIEATLAEIKQAKEDLLALARQANVQANAASEMAKLASDKKMANYAQNQQNRVNGKATNAIKNGLGEKLRVAAAPAVQGGRRRKTHRRALRKRHGTKRR